MADIEPEAKVENTKNRKPTNNTCFEAGPEYARTPSSRVAAQMEHSTIASVKGRSFASFDSG
tara:strand:+ start:744 stop:929 length:186 start_codon:yes stop_codon:yes gene_type:complete